MTGSVFALNDKTFFYIKRGNINATNISVNFDTKMNVSGGNFTGDIGTQNIDLLGQIHTDTVQPYQFDTLQTVWAFKYNDATGYANTGLRFNTGTSQYEFTVSGSNLLTINAGTGAVTAAFGGGDLISSDDIILPDFIYDSADPDTYIDFDAGGTADKLLFHAGGVEMLTLKEGSPNIIDVNIGDADVDFVVGSAIGDALVITGSNGLVEVKDDFNVEGDTIVFGDNSNQDLIINFDAASNDALIKFWEDEDYFTFTDGIKPKWVNTTGDINSTQKICASAGCIGDIFGLGGDVWYKNVNITGYLRVNGINTTGDKLYLGATGGANNERMVIDLDSTANRITLSSDTNAIFYWGTTMALPSSTYLLTPTVGTLQIASYGGSQGSTGALIGLGVNNDNGNGFIRIMERTDTSNINRQIPDWELALNPTFRFYSSDATQRGDYIDILHNQTDGIIRCGTNCTIKPNATLKIEGDADIKNNLTGNFIYGSMYNNSPEGYTLDLSSPEEYKNLSIFITGEVNGIDFDASNLTIQKDGIYKIDWSLSFSGTPNSQYGMGVAKNGDILTSRQCYSRRDTGNTAVGNVGGTCMIDLNQGEFITFVVDDEANPVADPTIYQASVTIWRLGG